MADDQIDREMSARALLHAVWFALREIQTLQRMGEDLVALENTFCIAHSAVSNLHRRIADRECRLDGGEL